MTIKKRPKHRKNGVWNAPPWTANKLRHNYYKNPNARKKHIDHKKPGIY